MLVVVGEETRGILDTAVGDEDAGLLHVLDDIRHLHQRLAAVVVGSLDLAEVGDERLEKGAPGLEPVCQDLGRAAVSWDRRVQGAVVIVWGTRLVDMEATSRQAFPTSAALQTGLATDTVLFLQCATPGWCRITVVGGRRTGSGSVNTATDDSRVD